MHALLIVLALAVAAADPSPTPSPSPTPRVIGKIYHIDTLATVVSRSGSREAYTVSLAELRRLGARTVADALRFVPGVVVQQYGPPGSLQTVQLRGASASQTLVLLDGRPANESDTGVTDFTSMPLDSIASISVIEGGLSTIYGSGAVGGVIALRTATRQPFEHTVAYAQTGYEGEFASGLDAQLGSASGLGARLTASVRSSRNLFDYPAFGANAAGTRLNNDARLGDLDLALTRTFGRVQTELHLGDNATEVGVPGSTEFGPAFVSTLARQQRVAQRSSLAVTLDENSSNFTRFEAYADGRRVHFYDPTPGFPYDTLVLATTRGFTFQHTAQLSAQDLLNVGYEGRDDRALFQGSFYAPPAVVSNASTTAYHIADTYARGDHLRIDAGLRSERNQGMPAVSLPTVEAEWQFSQLQSVRGTYSRAFRAPNLGERFFPGFGNANLQPEYAASFDVGALFQILHSGGHETIGATYFGNDTTNLIVNEPIDTFGDFLPFNVGRSRVRGYSLSATHEINDWVAQASYTGYPRAADLSLFPDLNGVVNYGNRLLRRPIATSTLEVWRQLGYSSFGVDLRFEGQRYSDEENQHLLPAYATLGAHVIRPLSRALMLTVRVDNITGQRVEEVYGYPVLGTTFSVRLSTR